MDGLTRVIGNVIQKVDGLDKRRGGRKPGAKRICSTFNDSQANTLQMQDSKIITPSESVDQLLQRSIEMMIRESG